jgi:hypothetical protein
VEGDVFRFIVIVIVVVNAVQGVIVDMDIGRSRRSIVVFLLARLGCIIMGGGVQEIVKEKWAKVGIGRDMHMGLPCRLVFWMLGGEEAVVLDKRVYCSGR